MHSSGLITRKFGPSWKASTGQTSTQSVYLHLMQLSVTTKVMGGFESAVDEVSRWRCSETPAGALLVVKSAAKDGRFQSSRWLKAVGYRGPTRKRQSWAIAKTVALPTRFELVFPP